MKIKYKQVENGEKCSGCNYNAYDFYGLDGWENEDFLCGSCFAQELYESEADYQIIPNLKLKQGKI